MFNIVLYPKDADTMDGVVRDYDTDSEFPGFMSKKDLVDFVAFNIDKIKSVDIDVNDSIEYKFEVKADGDGRNRCVTTG